MDGRGGARERRRTGRRGATGETGESASGAAAVGGDGDRRRPGGAGRGGMLVGRCQRRRRPGRRGERTGRRLGVRAGGFAERSRRDEPGPGPDGCRVPDTDTDTDPARDACAVEDPRSPQGGWRGRGRGRRFHRVERVRYHGRRFGCEGLRPAEPPPWLESAARPGPSGPDAGVDLGAVEAGGPGEDGGPGAPLRPDARGPLPGGGRVATCPGGLWATTPRRR